MKNKVLIFIIGLLVGAIIATGCWFAYSKITRQNDRGLNGGNRPQMSMDGNNIGDGSAPEKPSGEQPDDGETPPEIPSENQTQDNTTSNS